MTNTGLDPGHSLGGASSTHPIDKGNGIGVESFVHNLGVHHREEFTRAPVLVQ
jgi:hypothetical protein